MPNPQLKEIEQQLDETSEISTEFINSKLRHYSIRCFLALLIYLFLSTQITWFKWTLIIAIPVALYHLWRILSTKNRLDKKVAEIRQTIDHIEMMEKR